MVAICLIVKLAPFMTNIPVLVTLIVLAIALALFTIIIFCQPQNQAIETFKVSWNSQLYKISSSSTHRATCFWIQGAVGSIFANIDGADQYLLDDKLVEYNMVPICFLAGSRWVADRWREVEWTTEFQKERLIKVLLSTGHMGCAIRTRTSQKVIQTGSWDAWCAARDRPNRPAESEDKSWSTRKQSSLQYSTFLSIYPSWHTSQGANHTRIDNNNFKSTQPATSRSCICKHSSIATWSIRHSFCSFKIQSVILKTLDFNMFLHSSQI